MRNILSREEALFADALAQPATQRRSFLDRACNGDRALLARLIALLAAHESPTSLEGPTSTLPEERSADLIGRYKLLEKLGEGGCGAVWAAEQREPVKRRVALKIIKLGMDTRQVIARFEAERQALAMMDHPNIAKMLDAGATETGRPYFVMELVRGIPITAYCDENNLTTAQRLDLMIKVCHAIQHAHQKGIIHRDIKPSNVLITLHDGVPVPKVIDFGIAKATQQELTEKTIYTKFQQFIGTPAYMSPEQAEMSGLDIDTRSDVYSLGVLLYELVTGRTPFDSKELVKRGVDEIRRTIRETEPPRPSTRIQTLQDHELTTAARRRSTDPRKLVAAVRGDLDWIVMRCIEKDRTRRYDTANGLAMDIQRFLAHEPVVARPPSTAYRVRKFVRRHRVSLAGAAAVIGVIVVGSIMTTAQALRALRAERTQNELRLAADRARENEATARRAAETLEQRGNKVRWAREEALPEINRLIGQDDISAAFALARQIEEYIPNDPALTSLWPKISMPVTIETNPAGADVYLKPYRKPDSEWQYLGKTPLREMRLARDFYRWQVRKDGYALLERADGWEWWEVSGLIQFPLDKSDAALPGMVRVQGGKTNSRTIQPRATGLPSVELADYWIDRCEVTNREFKTFVEAGGYAKEKYWKNEFVHDGRVLKWQEAMDRFRDQTGRPGPATWTNGTYPEDRSEYPVTGISWYEAAAYAEFIGKRLPSIYHWRHAAVLNHVKYVVPLSNFSRQGAAPVGRYQGITAFGAYDMAGNANEWCWNEARNGERHIFGAGWQGPEYLFRERHAKPPFDRSDTNGFRCINLAAAGSEKPDVTAPYLGNTPRDVASEKPAGDAEFQIYQRLFAYDKTRLEPRQESIDDSDPRWRKEKVSFNAAYNDERMTAFLFFPKKGRPPFQTIVFFPGSWAQREASSERLVHGAEIAPLVESNRVVIYPIYKGTYERLPGPAPGQTNTRDYVIQLVKDVGRAIDYLETRNDIQTGKLSYYGYSWGAARMGTIITAVETRLKASVLVVGGFSLGTVLPEIEQVHYAPRVTIPTLMLNGRYDSTFPLESSQLPLLRALGTPGEHKRHVVYDTGHDVPLNQMNAEILAWLDRYLGPSK